MSRDWALSEGLVDGDGLAEAAKLIDGARADEGSAASMTERPALTEAEERRVQQRVGEVLRERARDTRQRDERGISRRVREHFALHGIDLAAMAKEAAQ